MVVIGVHGVNIHPPRAAARIEYATRKRGRVVDCTGLENRRCFATSVSSNLTASAIGPCSARAPGQSGPSTHRSTHRLAWYVMTRCDATCWTPELPHSGNTHQIAIRQTTSASGHQISQRRLLHRYPHRQRSVYILPAIAWRNLLLVPCWFHEQGAYVASRAPVRLGDPHNVTVPDS